MDINYRVNIGKWLPLPSDVLEKWFADSSMLTKRMDNFVENIALIIRNIADAQTYDIKVYSGIANNLEEMKEEYKSISTTSLSAHPIYNYKMRHFLMTLKRKLNVLARFTRNLINEIVDCKSDELLRIIFRLVNIYNDMLDMDIDVSDVSTNVFCNDCPYMLEPMKKISVTRILQILAKNRAEESCHELIDCLLTNYEPQEKTDPSSTISGDADVSDNSSIEIYRALTRHLTPPIENSSSKTEPEVSNIESIQTLVNIQNKHVLRLLNVVQEISPRLLGTDALKTTNGETRLRRSAIKKVKNYYQEVAWGALSSILDHVVLWWSPEALATRHCHGAQQLKDWLSQFVQKNHVPQTVRPALQNLCDALRCHATIIEWDQLFRLAYTSAFKCQSKASSTDGSDTGQMFGELFQLLVRLSNECEAGGEWVIGAPLMELPLSEQIVVLHRLDHSVHTARLWIVQEAKIIAHTWELDVFFLLVKGDIVNCLEELSYLKLADHVNALSTDSVSVQVYVCAKMRAKIVSEVNVNVDLLQKCSTECTDILAKICRVVSLANLHMCFPRSSYWRKGGDVAPAAASLYVQPYFGKKIIFHPLLTSEKDYSFLRESTAPCVGSYRGSRYVEHDPRTTGRHRFSVVVVSTTTSANGGDMPSSEKTSLTGDNPSRVYYGQDALPFYSHRRRRQLLRIRCIAYTIAVAIFTMALVVTVSYSVSHDMMDAGPNLTAPSFESNANLTRSLKKLKLGFAPGSGSYTLFSNPSIAPSNSIFVPGQQPSRETVTNRGLSKEEVREGLKAGRQAVTERLFTDASTSPLTSPSPETRHRHAVSTCVDAGTLALAAVAELAATRKIEKLRESQGEPSAVGSFFDAGWKIFGACKQLTTPDCPPTAKYRTFDGSCNRPMQMGAAMTPFIRHLPPNYGDGINSPRRAVSGADLPSAREVSLIVHKPSPSSNPSFTVMLAVYGQFLDHDITATALSQGLNGTSIPCCPPSDAHPECFPVPVSSGDPVFDVAGRTCMDFVRSAPAPQCKLGPRQQLNQVSAFIDGSMIYGTEKNAAENLREFRGGRLRMQLTPDNRTLLPPSTDPNDGCNRETERRRGRYCFAAGDARANENLHLTTMHLLWARQHNRVAERLARINPSWDDQTLYEESRRVIGAQLQHVTYREFVPIVLGDEETDKRDLRPLRSGHREEWKLDDATVDPSIANSFATAAFRFAHTLLPGLMRMTDERAGTSSYVELHRMLFNPYSLYAEGGLRSSIASATGNVIQMTSAHVTSQLTNHLFEDPIANTSVPCGLDLVSLNIQRGRDHGLPGYTAWREYCGLGRVESFSDLDGHLDPRTLEDISSLYESVHDIDLYTGALAELPNAGSIVGSTFMCLIADQFVRLQRGDRFWYELGGQPHSFTEDQLTELRKMSLARLICDCSDEIGQIQAEVMRAIGPENPVISCEDIPAPSYEPWKEIERESFNWTGLRNDINNTIEEIVAYINNSRTNLDNDWAAFKNYVSDTFTDLRNQLSELHPTNDSQETQTPKERSDFETGEAYRYWNGLKGNVTRWLNRSMRTMTGGPAAVTKWMAFKRSVIDQFANLKDQIAATRADIAPKLATKKRYEQVSSNSSRISDAIPAIFDWKNFKSNIISSLNDTITNMKDDKMPPPIDNQATYRDKDEFSFRNEIDSQRSVEQESNVSSDWLAYKDQIVKTVNEIVDKIKNGMPPPGDPAWATYRNEIIKSFSNFETIPPSLERATLFNARENVPFHGSSVVTSNDVSNLTIDWSEFRARINDSVTRMMEDILSKRPTEIDPIAWATFRATVKDEFAGLRSEIGSIKDEWLETGRGENSSNLRANWFEYNYSDPFVVPSREEWDEFKKGINDTVMNILIIANSSDEFSFDELHKMFNRSFADLKNQLSSLRTLIEETYNNETAADWLIFQAQLNSTVKYLVDGLTANDELSIEDATDVLLKAEDELSNVRLPANSAAIPPTDWIRYASHVNKTISDALRNINETGRNHHGTMMLRAEETVVTSSSSSNDPEKIRTNWLIVPCLLASFATVSKFQIRV